MTQAKIHVRSSDRISTTVIACALFFLVIVPSPGSAQVVLLETNPVWTSSPTSLKTMSVAFGDIDADGDLDLVCGNDGEPNTMYLNVGGVFGPTPTWTSSNSTTQTRSVALGDIDGDGDLDLVCGNYAEPVAVYFNTGNTLPRDPVTIGQREYTWSIALADMDDDGDLDIVVGTGAALVPSGNAVYANDGMGDFGTAPVWRSAETNITQGVAVGDIDGNGYLDLVCGNGPFGPTLQNTVYFSTGGVLDTLPGWRSTPAVDTRSVALGDMNGDGTLDIVCGNFDAENTLYLNAGGVPDTLPGWQSFGSYNTESVVLGDVDGDGDLDVAVGNDRDSDVGNEIYLNTAGDLDTIAAWESEPNPGTNSHSRTRSVWFADTDVDGRLDLLCGNGVNTGEANQLYRNVSNIYGTVAWSTDQAYATKSVAVGDVDGDGYVDFVFGNQNEKNNLFKYDRIAGTYSSIPDWESDSGFPTTAVAVGDLNNDGYCDLVESVNGNLTGIGSAIFWSDGVVFSTSPDPFWSPGQNAMSLALGDVDNNGFLDIALGYGCCLAANKLYLNTGGTVSPTPAWSSNSNHETWASVLADVNLDGNLDWVCGNENSDPPSATWAPNNLYLGNGTPSFSVADPAWSSKDTPVVTSALAVGDINGDGLPDLVCGNGLGGAGVTANTIHLGDGRDFTDHPVWWSTLLDHTQAVALGDIDGDGDLDVICGNAESENTGYLNQGGTLEGVPSLRWPAQRSADVVVVDTDHDGDMDVVFGNNNRKSNLYLGSRLPAYKGDPAAPTNHLPNNAAHLRLVTAEHSADNRHTISFSAVDVESDPIWLRVDYQFEGTPQWFPIEGLTGTGTFGRFDASPAGTPGTIDWDIFRVPFDRRNVIVRLRVIERPQKVSAVQHTAPYLTTLGIVEPLRSELSASSDSLRFDTVTVGDTTSLDLVIHNRGTADLNVTDIQPPSTEINIYDPTSFTLPPGQRDTVRVFLVPERETDIHGDLVVWSDDPLTPATRVVVTTDIRALDVRTKVLTTFPQVPPGDAVTVEVAPLPQVRIEEATLYHRPAGAAVFADSLSMGWFGDRFLVSVPGQFVTEAGLEYYVKVENSPVVSFDPDRATFPDSAYSLSVSPPTGIVARARPDVKGQFVEGTPIEIEVELQGGSVFVGGSVHCRAGASGSYRSIPVAERDPLPLAIIPDSLVTSRGVEFWIEVQTLTSLLTAPPTNPAVTPYSIPVTVLSLAETAAHPGMQYRLLSVPLTMEGSILGALTDNLGALDNTRWRLFRYDDNAPGDYVELTSQNVFDFELGSADWLITLDGHRIDTGPARGVTTPTDRPHEITLEPGWNLVGNPFNFAVAWDSMTLDTLSTLVEPPRGWNGGWLPNDVEVFEPFDGYWVMNQHNSPISLRIPPVEAAATAMVAAAESADETDDWRISITASCGDVTDTYTGVGVGAISSNAWDYLDRSEPPQHPGEAISVYFPHGEWEERPGRYAVDMRPEDAEGHVWRFDVAKNFAREAAGDEVVFTFQGLVSLDPSTECVLIDRTLGHEVDLKDESQYALYLGERGAVEAAFDTRFALVVGSEAYTEARRSELATTPGHTALHQNFPNPFNPSTVIRYDVATSSDIELVIYNARGALVKVLERTHRRPGRYEVGWNGENERGEHVASGVYFYRLKTANHSATRKMVLLK